MTPSDWAMAWARFCFYTRWPKKGVLGRYKDYAQRQEYEYLNIERMVRDHE